MRQGSCVKSRSALFRLLIATQGEGETGTNMQSADDLSRTFRQCETLEAFEELFASKFFIVQIYMPCNASNASQALKVASWTLRKMRNELGTIKIVLVLSSP